MKKIIVLSLLTVLLLGCSSNNSSNSSGSSGSDFSSLTKEITGCYNYFKDTTNYVEGSPGYGLTIDRYTNKNMCSIAATGFLFASYPVFVEEGLMSYEEGKNILSKSLDTVINMQNDPTTSYGGCLAHFVSKNLAKRYQNSEISTIDTAILVSGAISASQYFKGDTIEKANTIWSNVDFNKFIVSRNSKSYISMGVDKPETGRKQLSSWDYYAEQLMIYILGVGNPNTSHRISSIFYKNITKNTGSYGGYSHIYSWNGSIFTYQYSQALFNFNEYLDNHGRNYYENSVNASRSNYAYCRDLSKRYKTFDSPSFGLTACDTPLGYSGELGALPRGGGGTSSEYLSILGTVAPTGAISSMPYTPDESIAALEYYQTIDGLNDPLYGLRDAFNLDFNGSRWIDPDFIGLDKAIGVIQMYNYKNKDFIANLAMQNSYVIEGFLGNEFVKR